MKGNNWNVEHIGYDKLSRQRLEGCKQKDRNGKRKMQLQKIKIKNCKNKVTQKSSTERVQKNRKNRKIKIAQNLVQLKKFREPVKSL